MRLALVTATPANIAFGSGTYVAARNLTAGLESLGHQVRIVQPSKPLRAQGFGLSRLAFNASIPASRVEACDLVCGFDMDGVFLARKVRAPFVSYLHGVIADEARFERGWTRISLRVQAAIEGAAARRARLVLVPSEYSAGALANVYGIDGSRIRVVPPGFDLAAWTSALGAARPYRPDHLTVLCVGRMYPRKNHAGLLRATALLTREFPGVQVRIVGDGPEKARLFDLAERLGLQDTVRFLGQAPFAALVEEYVACDLFCLPSFQEGFGIVFAEAMAAGKPIVACRAGAVPETVRDGENGLLAPPGDDNALAEALASLLRDGQLRNRIAGTNRAAAQSRYGLEPAAKRFMDVVLPLL